MSHKDMFIKMLQEQKDAKETNWSWDGKQIEFEVNESEDWKTKEKEFNIITCDNVFVFDKDGIFVGIANCKQ